MKIGYGKIGRSMPLTLAKCGTVGGDNECVSVVLELARRHPEHEFVLIGRNSGENPAEVGLPPNVINPWTRWKPAVKEAFQALELKNNFTVEQHLRIRGIYDRLIVPEFLGLDGLVLWVGQHGTSNSPIPKVEDPNVLTKPQDCFAHYSSFIFQGINAWRDVDPVNREEVYLNADPRNYHKMRDLKWPLRHPVLTQFNFVNDIKHCRYGDTSLPTGPFPMESSARRVNADTWSSRVKNVYSRLEVCGILPGTPVGDLASFDERWENRRSFGLFINEARREVNPAVSRINALRDWVLPLTPAFIHGTWSDASLLELGMLIEPAPWENYYPLLWSVRSTFTTPSSGSGWATTKPWEAFAAGTACFFHPCYDTQDHILKDADPWLRSFLRVPTRGALAERVRQMDTDRETWTRVVTLQHEHFVRVVLERRYLRMIEDRLFKKEA